MPEKGLRIEHVHTLTGIHPGVADTCVCGWVTGKGFSAQGTSTMTQLSCVCLASKVERAHSTVRRRHGNEACKRRHKRETGGRERESFNCASTTIPPVKTSMARTCSTTTTRRQAPVGCRDRARDLPPLPGVSRRTRCSNDIFHLSLNLGIFCHSLIINNIPHSLIGSRYQGKD